jgi:pyrroloquinoline-quinone synthase
VTFFDRLEDARRRWNVLEHSFYLRWSSGELTGEELAYYAGQYRHAVVALADAVASTGSAEHAAEEAEHVGLWDDFARAAGAAEASVASPETRTCVEAWTAGRDSLEALATTYAIESGQPAISRTKLEGLLGHYGFEEGPSTAYFSLHASLDERHAAHSRELIGDRLADADEERLLDLAVGALRGNLTLLDGVERAFVR